jgi:hypothetical protein
VLVLLSSNLLRRLPQRRRYLANPSLVLVDVTPLAEELICRLHRHTTEIRHKVGTVSVAGDVTFRAFARVLPS